MRAASVTLVLCVLPALPAVGPPDLSAVIFDTSPRLTAADFTNIQRTVQFAYDTWLTERERERLYRGVTDEWLVCDAVGRTQVIEFGAVSSGIEQLSPESLKAFRENVLGAAHAAGDTGRPLGGALVALALETSSLLRRDNPPVSRHEAYSWVEMQELALSLAVGSEVRLPDELAAEAVRLALEQRPSDLAGADKRLARLRIGVARAAPDVLSRAVAFLRAKLGVTAPSARERLTDPLGLWTLPVPAGWSEMRSPPAGARLVLTHQSWRGASLTLTLTEPNAAIGDGTRPVLALVKETAGRLQGSPLAPTSGARALGASELVGKERNWFLLATQRAPGDTTLVTVVATCPADLARVASTDLCTLVTGLEFTEDAWTAIPTWAAAAELARADESAVDAGRRETRAGLREAAGLLAFKALGAPLGEKQMPEADLLSALGAPDSVSLLECPAGAELWRKSP